MKFLFKKVTGIKQSSHRLYAIGDVHGHAEELNGIIDKIYDDALKHPSAQVEIVLLGDVINRGPNSKSVIDRILQLKKGKPENFKVNLVRGNHEAALLDFLTASSEIEIHEAGLGFMKHGGICTLASYGFFFDKAHHFKKNSLMPSPMAAFIDNMYPLDSQKARKFLLERMPQDHIDLLNDSVTSYRYKPEGFLKGYFLCHGGINPKISLDKQDHAVLIGADYDKESLSLQFSKYNGSPIKDRSHSWVVVHGHTIVGHQPLIKAGRISTDTGCFEGKRLSCVIIADGEYERTLSCKSLYPTHDKDSVPNPANWPPKKLADMPSRSVFIEILRLLGSPA